MLKIEKYLILMTGLFLCALIDSQKKQITNRSIRIFLCFRGAWMLWKIALCRDSWKCEMLQAAEGFLVIGSLLFVLYFFVGKAIGAGDVKLLAVVGSYCGYEQTLWIVFFAAIFAMTGIVLTKRKTEIPFAPYIFCGALFVAFLEWLKVL